MQFSEDDLENENNEISLDDNGGEISWQDLLSSDEDDAAAIINDSDADNNMNESQFEEFDLETLRDDFQKEDKPAEAQEENKADLPIDKEASVNNIENIDDFNEILSDSNEEAPAESAGEFNEILSDNNEEINTYSENTLIDTRQPVTEDEIISAPIDDINVEGADLTGIVDDELLSLLDDAGDNKESEEKKEAIATFSSDGSVSVNDDNDNSIDLLYGSEVAEKEDGAIYSNETASDEPSVQEYSEDDYMPQTPKKKSRTPLLAVAAVFIFIFIVIGAFFAILHFTGNNSVAQNGNADEIAANIPDDFDTANKNLENNKIDIENEQAAKDAKELLDKVGSSKKNKEDDMVVVNVQTGGRSNPFVPSSLFNDKGNLITGATLPMPPDGVIDSPEAQEARKLLTISVTGIMFDPSKPSAILKFDGRDYFVQKGDRIDTYTVNQITRDYVAIRNAANIYKAYVGESFQLTAPVIPASNQMQYRVNTRQYISADDIQISTK